MGLGSAAVAFLVSLAVTPVLVRAARRTGLIDRPGERSSHDHPVPRGGGVACATGTLIAVWISRGMLPPAFFGVILVTCAYGAVGLFDDWRGIGQMRKLALNVAFGLSGLPWLLGGWEAGVAWLVVAGLACLFWIVGFSNVFNLMDGINGISVAQAVVTGTVWWLLGEQRDVPELAIGGVVLAAAALGFAPFNFPRARIFLGDVGSYYLGAWIATTAVLGLRAGLPPEAVLAPIAIYLADTATTLIRRVWSGEAEVWYLPHRTHAYQRLVDSGWSHARTTMTVAGMVALIAGLGTASLTGSAVLRVSADLAIVAVVVGYLMIPRRVTSSRV